MTFNNSEVWQSADGSAAPSSSLMFSVGHSTLKMGAFRALCTPFASHRTRPILHGSGAVWDQPFEWFGRMGDTRHFHAAPLSPVLALCRWALCHDAGGMDFGWIVERGVAPLLHGRMAEFGRSCQMGATNEGRNKHLLFRGNK